jgi:DNA-binding CsgD family transcriptional regulator/tetratricopeptide (TPR) repeat protein
MGQRSRSSRAPQRRLVLNRERELTQLRHALDGALCGRGQIVLTAGEAGIGKTTLAQEFAATAARQGVRVLWGRCGDRGGSPPYWPWAEILRTLAEAESAEEMRALFEPGARYISLVLPELRERFHVERWSIPDDHSVRFHVADAVRSLFHRAARQRSLLLVLDDLHWADQGSLFLLEFLAQDIAMHPLLVLATYRDGEGAPPLVEMLGELARLGVPRISLTGLTVEGAGRLLARLTGRRLATRVVRQIHARTGGNPFFVTEMATVDIRDPRAIPVNVRMAISKRLDRLSALANRVLAVAAVVGREFDFPLLRAALSDVDEEALLRAIDEGLKTLVIEPLPSRGAEWYQFTHALIRDAVYESVSPSRRARWHATIAQALETLLGDTVDDRAAELAQNAACAGALIEPAILAKYSRIAGERLLNVHAFAEALSHFERAWRAREGLGLDAMGAATLVGLGLAQAATAVRWNRQQGWTTLRHAIDYYVHAGEINRAIAVATDPHISVEGATDVAATIRQLHDLTPRGSLEEGRLLARMGAAEYFETGDYTAAQAAFARALEIAAAERDAGLELRTLAYATSVDHFDLRWSEVLARSRRIRDLARRVDDPRSEIYASYRVAFALAQTGHPEEASLESDATLALAEQLKDRGLLGDALYVKSLLAQLKGEWREARSYSDRALALSPYQIPFLQIRVLLECQTGHRKAGNAYLEQILADERRTGPWPLAGAITAIVLSQIGGLWNDNSSCDAALRTSHGVLERRPTIPMAQTGARLSRGLVAIYRSKPDECEEELEFLERFKGINMMPFLLTDRLFGSLAHCAGQTRRAIVHFENAVAFCRKNGYRPELAWTLYDYARTLLDSGSRDDRERAATLLREGHALSSLLGMRPLAAAIAAFRQRYGLRLSRKPVGLTSRELEILGLLSLGRTNKEIADALCISSNTVAVHVARVLSKTGSSNRTEAASYAVRHHLIGETRA